MTVVYATPDEALPDDLLVHLPKRDLGRAMWRGFTGHCPKCGKGKLFSSFIATNAECANCHEVLSHHRADDFPPYVTMLITGHVVVAAMLLTERAFHPDMWIHMVLWIPLTLIMSLGLLRPIKGAIVGLQWAFYMHGFNPVLGEDQPIPDPAGPLRS